MLLPRVFRVSSLETGPWAGCHHWKRQGVRAARTRPLTSRRPVAEHVGRVRDGLV